MLDIMIKNKQFKKIMNLPSYEFFANLEFPRENWIKDLEIAFFQAGRAMEGKCGIVVLYSQEEESFVEVAQFGYREEGYYYDFLARGEGNFEKVEASEKPLVFLKAKGYNLYHNESEYCIVARIYREAMLGFVLMEFGSGTNLELNSWVLGLIATRIGILKKSPLFHETRSSEFVEDILSTVENWQEILAKTKQKHYLTLSVESGKIRNKIVKYIHQVLNQSGELLLINFVPAQVGKFEKALEEWVQISRQGSLAFETIKSLGLAHQQILYEFIKKYTRETIFIFCELGEIELENWFSPFESIIRENLLVISKLSVINLEKRLSIFKGLIKEVSSLYNRKNITVSKEAMDFLEEMSRELNFEEIQNILESSILKCKDSSLTKKHLEEELGSREKSAYQHDLEDLDLRKSVEAIERQKILLAKKLFSGNQMRMAKALGISRGSLQYKMKQMGLL